MGSTGLVLLLLDRLAQQLLQKAHRQRNCLWCRDMRSEHVTQRVDVTTISNETYRHRLRRLRDVRHRVEQELGDQLLVHVLLAWPCQRWECVPDGPEHDVGLDDVKQRRNCRRRRNQRRVVNRWRVEAVWKRGRLGSRHPVSRFGMKKKNIMTNYKWSGVI